MNIPRSSSGGTMTAEINYEGIAVVELQFTTLSDSDRLRVGSVTD